MTKDNKNAASAPSKDVEKYLAALPKETRSALEQLRKAIRAAAPKAEEIISYQIPTYKYHGPLVHFVARKDYCSFIVISKPVLETFKSQLKPYDISGTTIHFSAERPLPAALVTKLVKARIAENEKRGARR